MRYRKYMIFAVLLFMVVGFAAVSTTLNFKGLVSVGTNEDDFKISFTRANLDGIDMTSTVVFNDGLTLEYKSGALRLAKEKSIMDFAITNNSKQYDATLELTCDELTTENATLDIKLDSNRIDAGKNILGKITVELTKDYPGENGETTEIDVSCHLKLKALERVETGEDAKELDDLEYKETILNGADPVLADGMIPVIIDEEGKVTYANPYRKWYKYGNKEWANAVILKKEIDNMYNIGNVIEENDIEAYFVWIPRYRYKLWNVDNDSITSAEYDADRKLWILNSDEENATEQTIELGKSNRIIDIMFETKDDEVVEGDKNNEWLTHPAFTSLDVNGLWVGKFETGLKETESPDDETDNNSDAKNIIVKPNTSVWRCANINEAYTVSLNYKSTLNSHLMKNTEWGAVTYLTLSTYGIGPEMSASNNAELITGMANDTDAYNSEQGYKGSTTGNITGIYDMAGGDGEMVAFMWKDSYVQITQEQYTAHPEFVDIYTINTEASNSQYKILGDATGEMGPFYSTGDDNMAYNNWSSRSLSIFPNNLNSYLVRGASNYGIMSFEPAISGDSSNSGSRIVLATK